MQIEESKRSITSGTKEWADSNVNVYLGCKHIANQQLRGKAH